MFQRIIHQPVDEANKENSHAREMVLSWRLPASLRVIRLPHDSRVTSRHLQRALPNNCRVVLSEPPKVERCPLEPPPPPAAPASPVAPSDSPLSSVAASLPSASREGRSSAQHLFRDGLALILSFAADSLHSLAIASRCCREWHSARRSASAGLGFRARFLTAETWRAMLAANSSALRRHVSAVDVDDLVLVNATELVELAARMPHVRDLRFELAADPISPTLNSLLPAALLTLDVSRQGDSTALQSFLPHVAHAAPLLTSLSVSVHSFVTTIDFSPLLGLTRLQSLTLAAPQQGRCPAPLVRVIAGLPSLRQLSLWCIDDLLSNAAHLFPLSHGGRGCDIEQLNLGSIRVDDYILRRVVTAFPRLTHLQPSTLRLRDWSPLLKFPLLLHLKIRAYSAEPNALLASALVEMAARSALLQSLHLEGQPHRTSHFAFSADVWCSIAQGMRQLAQLTIVDARMRSLGFLRHATALTQLECSGRCQLSVADAAASIAQAPALRSLVLRKCFGEASLRDLRTALVPAASAVVSMRTLELQPGLGEVVSIAIHPSAGRKPSPPPPPPRTPPATAAPAIAAAAAVASSSPGAASAAPGPRSLTLALSTVTLQLVLQCLDVRDKFAATRCCQLLSTKPHPLFRDSLQLVFAHLSLREFLSAAAVSRLWASVVVSTAMAAVSRSYTLVDASERFLHCVCARPLQLARHVTALRSPIRPPLLCHHKRWTAEDWQRAAGRVWSASTLALLVASMPRLHTLHLFMDVRGPSHFYDFPPSLTEATIRFTPTPNAERWKAEWAAADQDLRRTQAEAEKTYWEQHDKKRAPSVVIPPASAEPDSLTLEEFRPFTREQWREIAQGLPRLASLTITHTLLPSLDFLQRAAALTTLECRGRCQLTLADAASSLAQAPSLTSASFRNCFDGVSPAEVRSALEAAARKVASMRTLVLQMNPGSNAALTLPITPLAAVPLLPPPPPRKPPAVEHARTAAAGKKGPAQLCFRDGLVLIFSFGSLGALAAANRCCREWRTAVSSMPACSFQMSFNKLRAFKAMLSVAAAASADALHRHVSRVFVSTNLTLTEPDLALLAERMPHVQSLACAFTASRRPKLRLFPRALTNLTLDYPSVTAQFVLNHLPVAPLLRRLDLRMETSDSVDWSPLLKLQQIEALLLMDERTHCTPALVHVIARLPSLKEVGVPCMLSHADLTPFRSDGGSASSIQLMHFEDDTAVTAHTFHRLAEFFPNVTSFEPEAINFQGDYSALLRLSCLKRLRLVRRHDAHGLAAAEHDDLAPLASVLQRMSAPIESLWLERTADLSLAEWEAIVTALPRLTSLTIAEQRLPSLAFLHLAHKLTELTCRSLSGLSLPDTTVSIVQSTSLRSLVFSHAFGDTKKQRAHHSLMPAARRVASMQMLAIDNEAFSVIPSSSLSAEAASMQKLAVNPPPPPSPLAVIPASTMQPHAAQSPPAQCLFRDGLALIFSFGSLGALAATNRCCKAWQSVVLSMPACGFQVKLARDSGVTALLTPADRLLRRHISRLHVNGINLFESDLHRIAERMSHVERFTFTFDHMEPTQLPLLPRSLTALKMDYRGQATSLQIVLDNLKHAPLLRSLVISARSFAAIDWGALQDLTRLEVLRLTEFVRIIAQLPLKELALPSILFLLVEGDLTPLTRHEISGGGASIELLRFDDDSPVDGIVLARLANCFSNLTHLKPLGFDLQGEGDDEPLLKFRRLKELKIRDWNSGGPHVAFSPCPILLRVTAPLESLWLEETAHCTLQQWEAIVTALPRLTSLTIAEQRVPSLAFVRLAPALTHLTCSYTDGPTLDDAVASLPQSTHLRSVSFVDCFSRALPLYHIRDVLMPVVRSMPSMQTITLDAQVIAVTSVAKLPCPPAALAAIPAPAAQQLPSDATQRSSAQRVFRDGLALIFSFGSVESANHAHCCCRSWRDALLSAPTLSFHANIRESMFRRLLSADNSALRRHVSAVAVARLELVTAADLARLAACMPQVRSLSCGIEAVRPSDDLPPQQLLSAKLTELDISTEAGPESTQILIRNLAHTPLLQKLVVFSESFDDVDFTVLQSLVHLHSLELSGNNQSATETDCPLSLPPILASLPSLKQIELWCLGHLLSADTDLAPFRHGSHNAGGSLIQQMNLSDCSLESVEFARLSEFFPNLTSCQPLVFSVSDWGGLLKFARLRALHIRYPNSSNAPSPAAALIEMGRRGIPLQSLRLEIGGRAFRVDEWSGIVRGFSSSLTELALIRTSMPSLAFLPQASSLTRLECRSAWGFTLANAASSLALSPSLQSVTMQHCFDAIPMIQIRAALEPAVRAVASMRSLELWSDGREHSITIVPAPKQIAADSASGHSAPTRGAGGVPPPPASAPLLAAPPAAAGVASQSAQRLFRDGLALIFSFSSLDALGVMARCCREWQAAVALMPALLFEVTIDKFRAFTGMLSAADSPVRRHVSHVSVSTSMLLSEHDLTLLAQRMPHAQSLACAFAAIRRPKLPLFSRSLTSLTINYRDPTVQFVVDHLADAPLLRKLDIHAPNLEPVDWTPLLALQHLEVLRLRDDKRSHCSLAMTTVLAGLSSLRNLDVSMWAADLTPFKSSGPDGGASAIQQLYFYDDDAKPIDSAALERLADCFPNLTTLLPWKLDLNGSYGPLLRFAHLNSLRIANLFVGVGVSFSPASTLVRLTAPIESLWLENTKDCTLAEWEAIVTALPRLTSLAIFAQRVPSLDFLRLALKLTHLSCSYMSVGLPDAVASLMQSKSLRTMSFNRCFGEVKKKRVHHILMPVARCMPSMRTLTIDDQVYPVVIPSVALPAAEAAPSVPAPSSTPEAIPSPLESSGDEHVPQLQSDRSSPASFLFRDGLCSVLSFLTLPEYARAACVAAHWHSVVLLGIRAGNGSSSENGSGGGGGFELLDPSDHAFDEMLFPVRSAVRVHVTSLRRTRRPAQITLAQLELIASRMPGVRMIQAVVLDLPPELFWAKKDGSPPFAAEKPVVPVRGFFARLFGRKVAMQALPPVAQQPSFVHTRVSPLAEKRWPVDSSRAIMPASLTELSLIAPVHLTLEQTDCLVDAIARAPLLRTLGWLADRCSRSRPHRPGWDASCRADDVHSLLTALVRAQSPVSTLRIDICWDYVDSVDLVARLPALTTLSLLLPSHPESTRFMRLFPCFALHGSHVGDLDLHRRGLDWTDEQLGVLAQTLPVIKVFDPPCVAAGDLTVFTRLRCLTKLALVMPSSAVGAALSSAMVLSSLKGVSTKLVWLKLCFLPCLGEHADVEGVFARLALLRTLEIRFVPLPSLHFLRSLCDLSTLILQAVGAQIRLGNVEENLPHCVDLVEFEFSDGMHDDSISAIRSRLQSVLQCMSTNPARIDRGSPSSSLRMTLFGVGADPRRRLATMKLCREYPPPFVARHTRLAPTPPPASTPPLPAATSAAYNSAQRLFRDGLALILSFASRDSLAPVSRCCRSWRDAVLAMPSLHLRADFLKADTLRAMIAANHSAARRHVTEVVAHYEVGESELVSLAECMPQMSSLKCKFGFLRSSVAPLLPPSLTQLHITSTGDSESLQSLLRHLVHTPCLVDLFLEADSFDAIDFSPLQQLTQLRDLTCYSSRGDDSSPALIESLSRVSSLRNHALVCSRVPRLC